MEASLGAGLTNTEVAARDGIGFVRYALELESQPWAEVVRKKAIAAWLDTPNDGFNGLKPVEVIERGEIDRLWDMIYFLGSGAAS